MNKLIWKREVPKTVGWYWFRNSNKKIVGFNIEILKVRIYGGDKLAVGNCVIEGCPFYEKGEWAGPIEMPDEEEK